MNVKVHHAMGAAEGNERWGPRSVYRAVAPSVRAIADLLDETVEEAQTVPYSSDVRRLIDDVEGEDVADDAITEYGARQAGSEYAAVALLKPPALPRFELGDEESTGTTEVFERAPVEARPERPPLPKPAPPPRGARADDSVPELLPLPLPAEARPRAARPPAPSLEEMDDATEAADEPSAVEEPSRGGPAVLAPLDARHLVPGRLEPRHRDHLASVLVEVRSVCARLAALLVDACRLVARIGSVPVPVAWTLAAFMLGIVVSQLLSVL